MCSGTARIVALRGDVSTSSRGSARKKQAGTISSYELLVFFAIN